MGMTSSILALALAGVLQEEPKLELNVPGATLGSVAGKIGEQMGWDVQVDPSVRSEVLVIRTDGMDPQKTLAKIAEVTGTRWILDGNRMLVQPDFDARNRERAKKRAENTQRILKAKGEFLKNLANPKATSMEGEEFSYEAGTGSKLLGQIVQGLGDQVFSRLAPGQRIVLSTNPTRMQQPLGSVNVQMVTKWIAETNEQRKAVGQIDPGDDEGVQQMMEMFGMNMDDMAPKPITEQPEKVVLVLARSGRSEYTESGVSVTLKVIGPGGKTLLSEMSAFGGGREMFGDFAIAVPVMTTNDDSDEEPARKPMPGDDLKIKPSEEYLSIRKATTINFENPNAPKVTPEIRQKLKDIENFEPLRFELGELLWQAAEKMDKPLIALLPDETWHFGEKIPETIGEIRDQFGFYNVVEKEEGGFWQVLPKEIGSAWDGRVDRTTLAMVMRAADGRTYVPLDPLATFLYQYPDATSNDVANSRIQAFAPFLMGSMMGMGSANELYRVYGAMTASERQFVRRGGQISLGQLSGSARNVLVEMFFGADGRIMPVELEQALKQENPTDMANSMFGRGMMFGEMMSAGGDEPTELMPTGLPMNGFVASQAFKDQYVVSVDPQGQPVASMPPFGRSEIAFISLLTRNPQFLSETPEAQEFLARIAAGERTQIHLAVMIAPKKGAQGVLSDMGDPDLKNIFKFSNMPGELGANAKADADAIAASPMGKFFQMMGSGGGMGGFGGGGTIKP